MKDAVQKWTLIVVFSKTGLEYRRFEATIAWRISKNSNKITPWLNKNGVKIPRKSP